MGIAFRRGLGEARHAADFRILDRDIGIECRPGSTAGAEFSVMAIADGRLHLETSCEAPKPPVRVTCSPRTAHHSRVRGEAPYEALPSSLQAVDEIASRSDVPSNTDRRLFRIGVRGGSSRRTGRAGVSEVRPFRARAMIQGSASHLRDPVRKRAPKDFVSDRNGSQIDSLPICRAATAKNRPETVAWQSYESRAGAGTRVLRARGPELSGNPGARASPDDFHELGPR